MRTWSWRPSSPPGHNIIVQADERVVILLDKTESDLAEFIVDALNQAEKAKAGEYEMSQKGKELHDEMASYADSA